MKTNTFDFAVIGSGPAAVASLQAFQKGHSLAVVTGEAVSNVALKHLHAKIRTVSIERGESPGVVASFQRTERPDQPLVAAASMGGFANYWGQQFRRYSANDPWPKETFPDFSNYQSACSKIEEIFFLSGGEEISLPGNPSAEFRAYLPRLMGGSLHEPKADLYTMRSSFEMQAIRSGAKIFNIRLQSISRNKDGWNLRLSHGENIHAKKIILASGVLGTADILANSFADIRKLRFADHAPWMMYTAGLRHLLRLPEISASNHFNAITLEKVHENACVTFASLYNMGHAEINLLLASVASKAFTIFKGWRAPSLASIICPVQIWTTKSFDNIEINVEERIARSSQPPGTAIEDTELTAINEFLHSLGARSLATSRTPPGFGYHYHNLRVISTDDKAHNVDTYLHAQTGGSVICVDASTLSSIGLRPHTLTAMANSYWITERKIDEWQRSCCERSLPTHPERNN